MVGFAFLATNMTLQRDAKAESVQRRTAGQTTQPGAEAMKRWSPIPPPELLAPPDPAQVYTVEPIPVRGVVPPRTPQQEQLLKEAAAIISRARPIPVERIQFFDWMNADDSPVAFTGWGIFVERAVAVPGGWLITIHVNACSSPARVNNIFVEEYLWTNGNLQFLRGYPHPRIGSTPSISLGV